MLALFDVVVLTNILKVYHVLMCCNISGYGITVGYLIMVQIKPRHACLHLVISILLCNINTYKHIGTIEDRHKR